MIQIDWYVTATASTGTVATSEVVTVTTKDARSTATAISPSGIYADDSVEGITFTWQHSIETGTKQCGWEISYSQDSGASYTVLASADTDAQTYTSNPGTFVSGTIYWRVRTKNTDGVFGDYSGVAVFAVRRAPAAPVITYHTNKPLAELRWQSAEQVGYEVEVDGESQGLVYGSEKSWQSNQVLTDGSHTVRVRIVNTFGDQSACRLFKNERTGEELRNRTVFLWAAQRFCILMAATAIRAAMARPGTAALMLLA